MPQAAASLAADLTAEQRGLFDTIRRWRYQTAQHDGVPPYVVLTNRNLLALVHAQPQTMTALAAVRGIGKAKLQRHGEALLMLLRSGPTATEPALIRATEETRPSQPLFAGRIC